MILGLGVLQLNTFLDGLIASYPVTVGPTIFGIAYPLEEGAMAAVSFAQRLYQFPLGVFGIAIATAIYPQLARLTDDRAAFTETLRRGLRLVVFIGLPASAGLILVREPLTAVILEGGRFSTADTERVARVLLWYAPAIWSYSMVHVLTRACYARRDSAAPVRIAVAIVGLNLLLNATLIWTPLREAGLAMSTAICSVIQTVALTIATRRHAPGAIDRPVASSWLRSAVLTALVTAAVAAVALILPPAETWRADLLTLATLVVTGVATAVAVAALLRMPELGWVGRKKG
jgi:putative peptidoglycan lipid II flippase